MKFKKFENVENVRVLYGNTASHNVDPQNGFTPLCPNELPVPEGHLIAEELAKQNSKFKIKTLSRDIHPSNAIWIASDKNPQLTPITGKRNVDLYWNAHCMSGTYGSEILKELGKIDKFDFLVNKGVDPNLHPYTGVYHDQKKKISTGLIEFYEANKITTVVVGGLALNYCVGDTVIDLCDAGFQVILNLAATRGLGSDDELKKYVDMLVNEHNVFVVNSVDDIELI